MNEEERREAQRQATRRYYWRHREEVLERDRAYRAQHPEVRAAIHRRSYLKHQDEVLEQRKRDRTNAHHKFLARDAFSNALRAGRIERQTVCEDCGQTKRLDGHHPDYTRPLDVVWLCRQCHTSRHWPQPKEA